MKKVFFVLLAILCLVNYSNAQKPFELSMVIQQDSLSAQDLYEATRNWFAESYVDSKAVIRDDNPGKQITGKGSIPFECSMMYSSINGFIEYLIDIQFREGRLKLTTRNFSHVPGHRAAYDNNMGVLVDPLPSNLKDIGISGANRKASYKYFYKHGKPLCEEAFNNIALSLKEFLSKRKVEAEEDW